MKKKLFLGAAIGLSGMVAFCFAACSDGGNEKTDADESEPVVSDTEEEEGYTVEWQEYEWTYMDADGETATLSYALYFPEAYSDDGEALPLVTYIPDASYRYQKISSVEKAACPTQWITEENMSEYPAVFLVLTLTANSSTDSETSDYLIALSQETSEETQVVNIIDNLVSEYNIDENRLYLTGQSMGGIFDFALNTVYPEKFAATVYVSCQPGGDIPDEDTGTVCEMYDEIIEAAEFADQTFVYIVSRMDEKAPYGQDDVENVLKSLGQTEGVDYGKDYTLSPTDFAASSAAAEALFAEGYSRYFLGFPQVASGGTSEHMLSFTPGYSVNAIYIWLLGQSLAQSD